MPTITKVNFGQLDLNTSEFDDGLAQNQRPGDYDGSAEALVDGEIAILADKTNPDAADASGAIQTSHINNLAVTVTELKDVNLGPGAGNPGYYEGIVTDRFLDLNVNNSKFQSFSGAGTGIQNGSFAADVASSRTIEDWDTLNAGTTGIQTSHLASSTSSADGVTAVKLDADAVDYTKWEHYFGTPVGDRDEDYLFTVESSAEALAAARSNDPEMFATHLMRDKSLTSGDYDRLKRIGVQIQNLDFELDGNGDPQYLPTDLAEPRSAEPSDCATKKYVDTKNDAFAWKAPCRLASDGVFASATLVNNQTRMFLHPGGQLGDGTLKIDGIVPSVNDRILFHSMNEPKLNGVWEVFQEGKSAHMRIRLSGNLALKWTSNAKASLDGSRFLIKGQSSKERTLIFETSAGTPITGARSGDTYTVNLSGVTEGADTAKQIASEMLKALETIGDGGSYPDFTSEVNSVVATQEASESYFEFEYPNTSADVAAGEMHIATHATDSNYDWFLQKKDGSGGWQDEGDDTYEAGFVYGSRIEFDRAKDMDAAAEFSGASTFILEGDYYRDVMFHQKSDSIAALVASDGSNGLSGGDDILWIQGSGMGQNPVDSDDLEIAPDAQTLRIKSNGVDAEDMYKVRIAIPALRGKKVDGAPDGADEIYSGNDPLFLEVNDGTTVQLWNDWKAVVGNNTNSWDRDCPLENAQDHQVFLNGILLEMASNASQVGTDGHYWFLEITNSIDLQNIGVDPDPPAGSSVGVTYSDELYKGAAPAAANTVTNSLGMKIDSDILGPDDIIEIFALHRGSIANGSIY